MCSNYPNHIQKNISRAQSVQKLIIGYTTTKPLETEDYEIRDGIVDVVADIFHLCAMENLDFQNLVEIAETHYIAEISGSEPVLCM